MNEEKRLQFIQIEKNEIENDNKNLRLQLSQKDDEIERMNLRIIELEHEANQANDLRMQIDEVTNKNQIKDQSTREREENLLKIEVR